MKMAILAKQKGRISQSAKKESERARNFTLHRSIEYDVKKSKMNKTEK
jgi:hypothetical protein